jgi:uncharacterized protein YecE (DUF72 family)
VHIGTSGWHYRHWRGGLYPASMPPRLWLERYAQRFSTVELNNAFYRLPDRSTFAAWAAVLPDDFVISVKASRYLTHVRRLAQPAEPVHRLMDRVKGLGPKQGPVLLQLPPTLRCDVAGLGATLAAFPPGARVAVECRHDSWFVPAVRAVLERRNAAWCWADAGGPRTPLWRTADWGYVRFHGGRARPASCYGRSALKSWARRLASQWSDECDVFVYFNNDLGGCAPRDAHRLAVALGSTPLTPTRVPTARQVPLTA